MADEVGRAINPRTDWDRVEAAASSRRASDARLHDARHAAATVLLLLGVHERTIMSILGWSTTSMVSRYAHVVAPITATLRADSTAICGPAQKAARGRNETRPQNADRR